MNDYYEQWLKDQEFYERQAELRQQLIEHLIEHNEYLMKLVASSELVQKKVLEHLLEKLSQEQAEHSLDLLVRAVYAHNKPKPKVKLKLVK